MPAVYESKELHFHHVICFPKTTQRRKMSSNYILVTLKNFHSRLKMKTNTRIWEIVYNFCSLIWCSLPLLLWGFNWQFNRIFIFCLVVVALILLIPGVATQHSVRIIIFFLIEYSNRQQVTRHTVDCSIYWKSRYCICSITIMKLMISNLFNKLFLHLNIYIKFTSWWDHNIVFTQKYTPLINRKHAACSLP